MAAKIVSASLAVTHQESNVKRSIAPLFVAVPLALAMVATGCTAEREYENQYGEFEDGAFRPNSDFYTVTSGSLELQRARLGGDIGPVRGLNDDATTLNGWHEQTYTNLEVIVENDRGEAAMTWLDINGGIFHPALRPGETFTFRSGDYPNDPQNELYVSGVTCSTANGRAGQWDFDQPIDEVTVEVQDGPDADTMRLNFTTRTGSDISTGFVDYAPQG